MSNFGGFTEKALLGATLLGSTYTSPVGVFVGLLTALTTVGTEPNFTEVVSGFGYGRRPATFSAPTSGPDWTCIQTGLINFNQATDSWGFVSHFAIFDSLTHGSGNLLYWGDRPGGAQEIVSGSLIEIPNGELKVRLD